MGIQEFSVVLKNVIATRDMFGQSSFVDSRTAEASQSTGQRFDNAKPVRRSKGQDTILFQR